VRNANEPPTAPGSTIGNRDLFHPQAKLAWFAADIAKLP
jgi:hypothetical protein